MGACAGGWPSGTCTVTFRRCLMSATCSALSPATRSDGCHGANTGSRCPDKLAVEPLRLMLPPPRLPRDSLRIMLEDPVRGMSPPRSSLRP